MRKNEGTIDVIPDFESVFSENKGKKDSSRGIMKYLIKRNLGQIILSVFLYLIKSLPVWIVPLLTADVIDVVTNWSVDPNKDRLIIDCVVMLVMIIQNIPSHMLNAKVNDRMVRNTRIGLKTTIVRKLQSLSLTYHKEIESGKIQAKFLKDTENADSLFRQIVSVVFPTTLSVLVACGISFARSPLMTLFFLIVIPVNVTVTTIYYKTMRKNYREVRMQNEQVSSRMARMLTMYPITKAHGLENDEFLGYESDAKKLFSKEFNVDRTQASFGSTIWVVEEVLKALCLMFSVYMTLKGHPGFTIGSIVLYQSLFGDINGNVQRLVNILPQIASGGESLRSLAEIMNSDDIEINTGKLPVSKVEGNIEFKNVSYSYPNASDNAVKDVSFSVKAGECVAFVGSSGSGKTTVMNMIIGFLKPKSGDIYIDGKSINDINLVEYRHNISVVPQNAILFTGSIRDNITYGKGNVSEEELKKVLDMANVTEFLPEMPDGIDTNVGERGEKLSGGQRQRVTIARALIRNPSILILDEATSALDNVSEYHVQKAIDASIKQRTTFVVAHRLSTIRNADRIVVMEEGKIVETGTYDELMRNKGRFFELKSLADLASKSLVGEPKI